MAKSMTVGKRENEKKRLAKREEKLKKKESKKLSGSSNSFEDMIAYVDENGMITSTPPAEDIKKEEINPDEIICRKNYSKSGGKDACLLAENGRWYVASPYQAFLGRKLQRV